MDRKKLKMGLTLSFILLFSIWSINNIKNQKNEEPQIKKAYAKIADENLDYTVYHSYLGGNYTEYNLVSTYGPNGHLYIAGTTESSDFPVTTGCFDETYNNSKDGILGKFNAEKTEFEWATYIGGFSTEWIHDIYVNDTGYVYITGTTNGAFPFTEGAYMSPSYGMNDVFVTIFNPSGAEVLYSTIFGGTGDDQGHQIFVNQENEVYIMVETNSANFPTNDTPYFDNSPQGNYDVAICQLSSDLSELKFSSCLGHAGEERIGQFDLDDEGNIVIIGETRSQFLNTTSGCYQNSIGGTQDGFIMKLNQNASILEYSSYFGGSSTEGNSISKIQFVREGEILYIFGTTSSYNYPVIGSYINNTFSGGSALFISKFNLTSSLMEKSTYIDGDRQDYAQSITMDQFGMLYLSFITNSSTCHNTENALHTQFLGGAYDAAVMILPQTLDEVIYCTYLGGNLSEFEGNIIISPEGHFINVGRTGSANLNTTENAFDHERDGSYDFYIYEGQNPVVLPNPVFITENNSIYNNRIVMVEWESIEGAEYYKLVINGLSEITTTETQAGAALDGSYNETVSFQVFAYSDYSWSASDILTIHYVVDTSTDDDTTDDDTTDDDTTDDDTTDDDTTDDDTTDDDTTDDDTNPTTNKKIPGYSIEIIVVMLISIVLFKRKSLKIRKK